MSEKVTAEWKVETLQHIRSISNFQLFNEVTDLAGGDDYDGCFTNRGDWEYAALQAEFKARMFLAGFTNILEDEAGEIKP